jgi:hypothetical protein
MSKSEKKIEKFGQNVSCFIENEILNIQIDLSKSFGLSASGKTISIASTKGNKTLQGRNEIIGVNCYKYPEK